MSGHALSPAATLPLIGLYGGTFDPLHRGHLEPVQALARTLQLSQVRLMPNNVPPHRPQPVASAAQRAEMVRLACAANPLFVPDLRELQRSTPSYTIETLEEVRREIGPRQPLAFIIGQDSLLTLPSWFRWQELTDYAHLLVCARPGYERMPDDAEFQRWLHPHLTTDCNVLHHQPAGTVFLAETPEYPISATAIRQRLQNGQPCDDWLTCEVATYITQHGLYSSR